jgi:hypothetical protein
VCQPPAETNSSGLSGNLQCSNGNFELALFRRIDAWILIKNAVNLYSNNNGFNSSPKQTVPGPVSGVAAT